MNNFNLKKYLAEGRLFKNGYEVEDFLGTNFSEFKNDVAYDEGYRFEIPIEVFIKAINDNLEPYTGNLGFNNGMITFIGGA